MVFLNRSGSLGFSLSRPSLFRTKSNKIFNVSLFIDARENAFVINLAIVTKYIGNITKESTLLIAFI